MRWIHKASIGDVPECSTGLQKPWLKQLDIFQIFEDGHAKLSIFKLKISQ